MRPFHWVPLPQCGPTKYEKGAPWDGLEILHSCTCVFVWRIKETFLFRTESKHGAGLTLKSSKKKRKGKSEIEEFDAWWPTRWCGKVQRTGSFTQPSILEGGREGPTSPASPSHYVESWGRDFCFCAAVRKVRWD